MYSNQLIEDSHSVRKMGRHIAIIFIRFTLIIHLSSSKFIKADETLDRQVQNKVPEIYSESGGSTSSNDDRISKMEAKSRHQENEIALLKEGATEDKKVINRLRDRVAQLEELVLPTLPTSNDVHTSDNNKVLERPKRLFRLISPSNVPKKGKNVIEAKEIVSIPPFSGPATNCQELGQLGYTLNGYHLVKSNNEIKIVYCGFQRPAQGTSHISEITIGNVEVKTKNVHFFVQRNQILIKKGTIPFQVERLNDGGAMNLTSGVFTAPVNGIYDFEFAGIKDRNSKGDMHIFLEVNGSRVSGSYADNLNKFLTLVLSASLRLKVGDRVNLHHNIFGNTGTLYDDQSSYTYFTGRLTKEDLQLS